ncbi:GAF domain-containing protein [Sphingomonas sp. RHCKR7]|uniref:GAF domain-containing protein n=1 Tax=Sphingomonas folli TaxID=2862497 RepID=UPI001C664191|nr:GAF domain-containing protein [Sphingomonas folli]MBW6528887.1 GAF domain-containing protein [Sphingomonas folli]
MGITVYEPAPTPPDEPARERLVEGSGALTLRDDGGLRSLVEDVRETLQTQAAAVSIVYKDWHYVIAGAGYASGAYSRRTSLCGHAILSPNEVFHVADITEDTRFAGNPALTERDSLRFYAAAPLLAGAGLPLGTLCVFDRVPRVHLATSDRSYLRRQAGMVVARLERLQAR